MLAAQNLDTTVLHCALVPVLYCAVLYCVYGCEQSAASDGAVRPTPDPSKDLLIPVDPVLLQ